MKIPDFLFRLSLLEIFLFELICWLAIWLVNAYIATLLTTIITAIVFSILVIAAVSERIERSKVPGRYFWIMGLSVLAPVMATALYLIIFGGALKF